MIFEVGMYGVKETGEGCLRDGGMSQSQLLGVLLTIFQVITHFVRLL